MLKPNYLASASAPVLAALFKLEARIDEVMDAKLACVQEDLRVTQPVTHAVTLLGCHEVLCVIVGMIGQVSVPIAYIVRYKIEETSEACVGAAQRLVSLHMFANYVDVGSHAPATGEAVPEQCLFSSCFHKISLILPPDTFPSGYLHEVRRGDCRMPRDTAREVLRCCHAVAQSVPST
jgi:hypothetical protein